MRFAPERLPFIAIDPGNPDVAAQILASSRERAFLECRAGDERTLIGADEIRTVCQSDDGSESFGIHIANALIDGTLDLRAMKISFPLRFVSCVFSRAPRFDGADLHELTITDGWFTPSI